MPSQAEEYSNLTIFEADTSVENGTLYVNKNLLNKYLDYSTNDMPGYHWIYNLVTELNWTIEANN